MALPADAALFVPDGDRLVPTELARGPWSPDALHGGPVAGLVARAAELSGPQEGTGDGLAVARLTIELVRPVPLSPLSVTSALVRPGRRVQVLEVAVEGGGQTVALARVLRLRRLASGPEVPAASGSGELPVPEGQPRAVMAGAWDTVAFHRDAVEIRLVTGAFGEPGAASAWFRLGAPLVAGEATSDLQRTATLADFGNGLSSELHLGSHLFINADLTISVVRPMVGEWLHLDARTHYGVPGTAVAATALADAEGPVGTALQSLLIERTGGPSGQA